MGLIQKSTEVTGKTSTNSNGIWFRPQASNPFHCHTNFKQKCCILHFTTTAEASFKFKPYAWSVVPLPHCYGPSDWSWFSEGCSGLSDNGWRWKSPLQLLYHCPSPASLPHNTASGTLVSPSHFWELYLSRRGRGCWNHCKEQAHAPLLHTCFFRSLICDIRK